MAVFLGFAAVSGCERGDRPPLGTVHGKISLDGKPLTGARVGFAPKDSGRASTAVTDAEGHYELTYIRDIMGAKVGAHTVRVSTAHDRDSATETVPVRYNIRSTLQAEVAAGDNAIDFNLTTN
jgi:hypothetical protein